MKTKALLVLLALAAINSFAQRGKPHVEVDTVADMLARTPVDGESVTVRGITTSGDIDPITYIYNASAVDATNAVILSPTLGIGRYIHKWNGDVRVFGARTTNADNYAAIQAAANYAKSKRLSLYFPGDASGGIYYTSDTIICTNDPSNRPLFLGVRGDGIGRSRILLTGFNKPVIRLRGLGMEVNNITIGYASIQGVTNNVAIAVDLAGFNSSLLMQSFQLVNAYAGIKATSDDTGYATFSCLLQNGIIENCDQGIDLPSGSGNIYHNIYISAYGLPQTTRAIIDRSGISRYDQINIEHSNFRASPLVLQGSGGSFGRLHFEGVRLINSEPLISVQQATADIDHMTIINSYFNGHILSSITFSGTNATATVNDLSDAISGGHGIMIGDTVYIYGATDALYNGAKTVTAVTATTFTYGMSGTPAANAVVDLSGGYDYISAHRGTLTSSQSSILDTTLYENPTLDIRALQLRDNVIVNAASANRNGLLAVNELNGRLASMRVANLDTGSPSDPMAGRYLNRVALVASSVTSNIATVWTATPHMFSTNELAYFQANTAGVRTMTNWTVLSVPTPWSFTVAVNTSDYALLRETSSGFVVPVVSQITNVTRSSNIVTAKCLTPHYMRVGYKCSIHNSSVSSDFNNLSAVAIAVPDAYTFTYRAVGIDVASTNDTQAILAVYDAGLSEFLSTSTHYALKDFGRLYKQVTALGSGVISANSYDLTTNTFNGIRVGDNVSLSIFSGTYNPDIELSGYANANNSLVIKRRNLSAGSITNSGAVLSVRLHRN